MDFLHLCINQIKNFLFLNISEKKIKSFGPKRKLKEMSFYKMGNHVKKDVLKLFSKENSSKESSKRK